MSLKILRKDVVVAVQAVIQHQRNRATLHFFPQKKLFNTNWPRSLKRCWGRWLFGVWLNRLTWRFGRGSLEEIILFKLGATFEFFSNFTETLHVKMLWSTDANARASCERRPALACQRAPKCYFLSECDCFFILMLLFFCLVFLFFWFLIFSEFLFFIFFAKNGKLAQTF